MKKSIRKYKCYCSYDEVSDKSYRAQLRIMGIILLHEKNMMIWKDHVGELSMKDERGS